MKSGITRRVAAAVVLLLVAAGCNPFSDAGARRSMTVEPDAPGAVFVRRAGEEIEVTGRFSLAAGDVVRTVSPGARILLDSDRAALVANDSRVRVTGGGSLEVMGGSVLADSPRHMTLAIDDVTATTSAGLLRVDLLSASAGVAALEGGVVISAPGQEQVTLDPLFDASVTAGEILSPKPYRVEVDDDWDRLHLADVVELDEQLERYAAAISGQLGRSRLGESYFRSLEGKGAARSMSRWVTSGAYSAPDLLIGYSIAELDRSEPARSLARAFNLRRQGGQWGVIAAIMGVGSGQLVAGLQDLVFTAGALASAPGQASGSSSRPGPVSEGGRGRAGDGTGGSLGGGGDRGGDGNTESGDTGGSGGSDDGGGEPPPPEEEDCENLVDCVIGILPLDTGLLP